MEMTKKKIFETRRRLLAVVIFLGVSSAAGQTAAEDTIQIGNISLSDEGAVAAVVDDSKKQVKVPAGTTINVSGSGSKGILFSGGYGHVLDVDGSILSAGNAVEFNFSDDEFIGALVENFNLSGRLVGGNHAIYIGKNSFVKNININKGAFVDGDIDSDWSAVDAQGYKPDLVTNLNVNADFDYGGKISGANGIKLHVNEGTMKFSGSANVLSVDVGLNAKLFGGTFKLNDKSADLAEGFTDTTTGTFINHGTIGAGTPDTNLVINGNLISDGILRKASGGSAGSIVVSGNANVNGSTITTDSLLPNETATVLVAGSITGQIKNSANNPVQISGMLTATGEIVGNTITVTTHEATTTAPQIFDKQERETFGAMNEMFDKLDRKQRDEMRDLYNLTPPEAKRTLSQIASNDGAQVMSVAQQSTVADRMISDRITKIFAPDYVDVTVRPMKFSDEESSAPEVNVKVKVPSRQENNFWLNYMKNWGSLRGGTDYHGSAIVAGYDRPFGKNWRAGIFATYGSIGYGAKSSRATVYDTRLGLYAGCHNRQSDVYFYINGGQLRNSLHRGIYSLGLSTNANYKSRIIEFGGEYKYDLSPKKIWHVSPFVNFQLSHLKQNSYNERGAGIYNQHVEADSNTYFAAQAGLDLKRYYRTGMFGLRFGIKHGFTGADPDLTISYEGNTANSYRLRNKRDKTHFVFSVRGESEFARGWFMGGEAELQRGENDRDVTASIMLRRIW